MAITSLSFPAVAVALAAVPAAAQTPSVEVTDAWSRASLGGGRPGVLYLTLTNTGETPVTLMGLETAVAAKPGIHRSVTEDGQARMEPAGPVEIAPGATVPLAPGGLHGMLMQPTEQVKEGDSFTATLLFESADPVEVTVPVLGVTATGPES